MLLSIIIPTCNRYAMLGKCLTALSPQVQGFDSNAYEVIVTDDSPGDEVRLGLPVDFPAVCWNQGPRKGPAANRNSGASIAKGKWLIFIDDDCIPQPTLLSAFAEAMEKKPNFLIFEGATLPEGPQKRMDQEAPINERGGYLWSCNFAIQRDLFSTMGGFCELFKYAALEDVEFRERLKQKGQAFVFVAKASVVHPWRLSGPDGKHFRIQLFSHRLIFGLHPQLRPSYFQLMYGFLRNATKELLQEGPRMQFRGLGKWFSRKLTDFAMQSCLVFPGKLPPKE